MPSLIDIVDLAEALESKSVYVAADRCVVVRNRHARCRKCQDACPSDAFTIENNTLTLHNSVCVACGSCTTVCPTEALIPMKPFDADLAQSIADACINNEGRAVFACARIASKRLANSENFAEVPCLGRMEESILVELVAQGIEEVLLVDGVCQTCKFRACDTGITATVDSVNTILASMGRSVQIQRQSGFPEDMLVGDEEVSYGVSRRGFFTQARGTAKDAAEKTAKTVLKSSFKDDKPPTIRELLGMTTAGALPRFEPARRRHVLDAMDRLGSPQVEEMETRLWGNVVIDTTKCNSCGMCSVFCPTGALKEVREEDESTTSAMAYNTRKSKKPSILEFSMADCVQCRTCEDICIKKCLKVESIVSLEELFDFEPRIIELPEPPEKPALFKQGIKRL